MMHLNVNRFFPPRYCSVALLPTKVLVKAFASVLLPWATTAFPCASPFVCLVLTVQLGANCPGTKVHSWPCLCFIQHGPRLSWTLGVPWPPLLQPGGVWAATCDSGQSFLCHPSEEDLGISVAGGRERSGTVKVMDLSVDVNVANSLFFLLFKKKEDMCPLWGALALLVSFFCKSTQI